MNIFVDSLEGLVMTLDGLIQRDVSGITIKLHFMRQIGCDTSVVGIYDTIKMYSEYFDFEAHLVAGNLASVFVMAAAVPKDKRYVTESGIFEFAHRKYYGEGTYQVLKIATESVNAFHERIDSIVSAEFDFPKPFSQMLKEGGLLQAKDLYALGFKPIGG
jgi:hypothetical protein